MILILDSFPPIWLQSFGDVDAKPISFVIWKPDDAYLTEKLSINPVIQNTFEIMGE